MKHLLRGFFIAVLFICCNFQLVSAQPMQTLPVDKNVRIGKLENGLTYYIRHNALPEKRVEFYIAQKVGSILEEPQQRGLAHFLEHMAFNGTKHFPGDETGLGIIPWCETKGIKFGTNLNAYTSVDQTVYNISNVPTENQNVVDSCLLILHDWSSAINLADKEIDKERGVIREEWRSRNSGMLRIMTDAQATMYPDSKYADCMPIGSIDVINNFPYQDIRDYYAKWYRPDLQGIVIVGDINAEEMEAKLKEAKESGNEAEYQAARKLNAMMSAFSSIDDYYTSTSMIENVERYEEIYEGEKDVAYKDRVAGWYVFLHQLSPSAKTATYVADKLLALDKKELAKEVLTLGLKDGSAAAGVEEGDVKACQAKLDELK